MQFLENLAASISGERLAPYEQAIDQNEVPISYARYFWNIALSESLYPGLQVLEVTLRNSIHDAISLDRGKEDWFNEVLSDQELPALAKIKKRLGSQNVPLPLGQLVANSSFGFWVTLFNRRYENILWPRLLEDVFPFIPNRVRTRKRIFGRLNHIRKLRNRIFHYEPIWKWEELPQSHNGILEVIGWINPDMLEAVKLFDRFPEVYKLGVGHYEAKLSDYLEAENP